MKRQSFVLGLSDFPFFLYFFMFVPLKKLPAGQLPKSKSELTSTAAFSNSNKTLLSSHLRVPVPASPFLQSPWHAELAQLFKQPNCSLQGKGVFPRHSCSQMIFQKEKFLVPACSCAISASFPLSFWEKQASDFGGTCPPEKEI